MVTCLDATNMLLDEATERFKPLFNINNSKAEALRKKCVLIDKMVSMFDCDSLDVDIDEITMNISFTFVCEDFEVSRNDVWFINVLKDAKIVEIDRADDLHIKLKIVYSGVWVKAL